MAFSAILSSSSPTPSPLFSPSSPSPRRPSSSLKTLALPPTADLPPAAIALTSAAAIAAAISLSDPNRRRQQQSEALGGADDKDVVRDYFNNTGFERWRKIYGEATEGVNKVQLDIRLGHSKTVENAMSMLNDDARTLAGVTVCDAGCGTGSLSIPLAREGALVSASDISSSMVAEARAKAEKELEMERVPKFEVKDLESLEGRYDTVVCLDVLIHYPQEKAEGMIGHLASLAERRLVLSYAPKTFYFDLLKRVGELFPGPAKATRAYLHAERDVEGALRKAGWKVSKRGFINTQFYFANLIMAVPASSMDA